MQERRHLLRRSLECRRCLSSKLLEHGKVEYGHCSPTVRADFRSGVLRRLRRLGQVGECDDVVVVTACGFVEGSTARDDPESGVVDVAVYDVGGTVLFGEVHRKRVGWGKSVSVRLDSG